MPNLFVFTAGNVEAQANLQKSIMRPVNRETVPETFDAKLQATLLEIEAKGQGFYAWGATPGPQNEAHWNQMAAGDWVTAHWALGSQRDKCS